MVAEQEQVKKTQCSNEGGEPEPLGFITSLRQGNIQRKRTTAKPKLNTKKAEKPKEVKGAEPIKAVPIAA